MRTPALSSTEAFDVRRSNVSRSRRMQPLIVTNLTNVRYLTGMDISWGIVLLSRKKHLFVDGRYIERARMEAKNMIVHPIDDLEKEMKRLQSVRFEALDLTVDRLQRWKKRFKGTTLIPSTNVIEDLRRSKTEMELKAIRKACRITDQILARIPMILSDCCKDAECCPPTEKSLAWDIEKLAHDFGADELSFDTIVAFGPNTSRPHHKPTSRKLKKGDIVQIDMGVRVNGYCSDCSRVFFTEKPTEEQKKVFDLLVRIVQETTAMAKPGVSTAALDTYARKAMKKDDYDTHFLHSLGHGVGLEIHEGVSLSSQKLKVRSQKLKADEVITTEPGIYLEGRWGMRIEDTIVVTAKGGNSLTKFSYENETKIYS
jgi:Xaa-Pro aminopeptidase